MTSKMRAIKLVPGTILDIRESNYQKHLGEGRPETKKPVEKENKRA